MDIGGHCTFMTCNKLDFLPIKCRFCLSDFCEDHMTPERHSCANLPLSSSASAKSTAPIESLPPCPVNECTTSKGAMLVCDMCYKHFCIPHHLPESHRYCDSLFGAGQSTFNSAVKYRMPLESPQMPKLCRIRLKRTRSKTKKVLTWRHWIWVLIRERKQQRR